MTTFVELLEAIESGTPFTQPATVACTAAEFQGLTSPQIAGLDALNVAVIDIMQGTLTLDVGQALAFAESDVLLAEGDTAVVAGTGIGDLTPDNISALADKGFASLDASEPVTFDADQAFALSQTSIAFAPGDAVTVELSSDDVGEWAAEVFTRLAARGIDTIDVISQDRILALTVEQALAFAASGIDLAQDDAIVVTDSSHNLAGLSTADYTALHLRGIGLLDSTSDVVELTVAQAIRLADSELGYVAEDSVTIVVGSEDGLGGLTPARIEDLGNKGVDHIASDSALTLTAAQAAKLAGTAITFDGAGLITVQDSGSGIASLSAAHVQALINAGVDSFDASGDAIVLTLDQFGQLSGRLARADSITLADEGAAFAGVDPGVIPALANRGVVAIDATGDGELTLSFAQFSALGTIALTPADTVTVTVSAADLENLDLGDVANKHVDVLDAGEPVTLTADQAFDLVSSPLIFATSNTVSVVVAEGSMPFDADDFATLKAKGLDVIDVEGANGELAFTVSQALGFAASGITLAAGDTVKVVDSGAALAGLTESQFNALLAKGFTFFDANNDAISLTVAKLGMFDGHLAGDDEITLADSGNVIAGLDLDDLANLDEMSVVAIDATDNMLTLTVEQLEALHADVDLTAGDVVTLSGVAADFVDLEAADLAALVTRGIDKLNATNAVTLTVAQAARLAASGLGYTAASNVKVAGTADEIAGLGVAQTTALGAKGIDVIDVTEGSLRLNAAKGAALAAAGIALAAGDTAVLADTGANLAQLTASEIGALADKGISSIDASDNVLSLTASQLTALGTIALTPADTVTFADTGTALAGLSSAQIAELAAKGIDAIDASDNALALSVAQYNALGSVALTAADTMTLSDTGAALGALSAPQIAALAGKGVDAFDASNNALSLFLAQFNALGTVSLTAADMVTLADTGASLAGLGAAQMSALGTKGVDVYDLTENAVTLTAAQLASLGSVDFAVGDLVTVNGTVGADAITGKSSNDVIKGLATKDVLVGGNGNDQLWGGTGKDVLTGGNGQDIFVFDASLTRANLDAITDFSVADDTLWLDNKYLKKIGKGSASKPSKLNKNFFKVADKAKDGNDYVVYNKKTGVLYYDEDGSGTKAAVQIAKLAKNLKLTANDFFVI